MKNFHLHFQQLIEILCCTCCLNTIEADHLRNDDIKPVLFQKDNNFQHVSKTNKVEMFNFAYNCTLETTQLIFQDVIQ
jgi:hypothetical protein